MLIKLSEFKPLRGFYFICALVIILAETQALYAWSVFWQTDGIP